VTDGADTTAAAADGDAAASEQGTATWVPEPASPTGAPEFAPAGAGDRPEVAVGAAFAGGLIAALILKRLAR
jgi:hypothetical protein